VARLHTVVQARSGDLDAFESLVIANTPAVYRLVRAIVGEGDAPDVVQDVFLAAWRELPRLRNADRFVPWLHRIAVNRCRSTLRHRGRVREIPMTPFHASGLPSIDARPAVEARAIVEPVLAVLSFEQRTLIALHYAARLSLAEIGATLEVPTGTVKSRLNGALEALRRALREAGHG
jgi:RNA polymerase sigma factor (sigma-70 family)